MIDSDVFWSIFSVAFPIALVFVFILLCWRRVPADKAMVITGIKSACFRAKAA